MPLTVGMQTPARLRQLDAMTNGCECILQTAAFAAVHVHITTSHSVQTCRGRQGRQALQTTSIVAIAEQLDAQPCSIGKAALQPLPLRQLAAITGQPDGQTIAAKTGRQRQTLLDILATEVIAALIRRTAATRDEPAQLPVTAPVGGQQHQPQTAGQREAGADDQRQSLLDGCHMRTHHAGHRALIGDR